MPHSLYVVPSSPHSLYVVPSSPSLPQRRMLHLIATTTAASTLPHACATRALFFFHGSPHHDSICLFSLCHHRPTTI
ncbi:hypothetical protein GmHk_04G011632 [Glycine max]|nr:hypothetical protein GmHk_04G011632 [Glycine max]